ncbi:Uncharacterised protein g10765 [Pycnogonum litorale]
MLRRLFGVIALVAAVIGAPSDNEKDSGVKVAYALEQYGEYISIPSNQEILLNQLEREEEEDKVTETKSEGKRDTSAFDSILNEIGSAKEIISGFPMIIDASKECLREIEEEEEEVRIKRGVFDWLKDKAVAVGDFFTEDIPEAAGKVKSFIDTDVKVFFKEDVSEAADNVKSFLVNDVKKFFEKDVKEFFAEDVVNFFKKDVKEFVTKDVKTFFVEGYEKAKEYLGLNDEDGRSTFGERMDDFLSTTRKGLKKAGKFGYCVVVKNLNNPLLKTIVDIF